MIRTRFSDRMKPRRPPMRRRSWWASWGDLGGNFAPVLLLALALASAAADFVGACEGLDQPTPANQTSLFDDEGSGARDKVSGPSPIDPPCLMAEGFGIEHSRSRCMVWTPQALGAPEARATDANRARAPPLS
jgi:hypothetical protein